LRDLPPGGVVELWSDQDPQLLLNLFQISLHGAIQWDVLDTGPPNWLIRIVRRRETAAGVLAQLLAWDHHRLNELLCQSLQAANQADTDRVREVFGQFATGIRRHMKVEEDLVLPLLEDEDGAAEGPIRTIERDHREIRSQVQVVEHLLAETDSGEEIVTSLGLLTWVLANHEEVEGQWVLPAWETLLRRGAAGDEQAILQDALGILTEDGTSVGRDHV
jgi:hemerythrin superfamily protein